MEGLRWLAPTRIFAVKVSPRGQLLYSRLFPAESGYAEVYRPNPGPPIGIAVNARGESVGVGSTVIRGIRTCYGREVNSGYIEALRDPSGGPVTAMVMDPKNPDTVYTAFDRPGTDPQVAPGLWKITEGGAKYESAYNGFQVTMPFASGPLPTVTALAIDQVNPSNLWAGTTGYIYLSTDAGANWVRGPALDPPFPSQDPAGGLRLPSNISRILVDTRDPGRLYACCGGRAVCEEEDYCSPPLAEERAAVLDEYFGDIEVERVEPGDGCARIASLPRLLKR